MSQQSCPHCDGEFDTARSLRSHIREHVRMKEASLPANAQRVTIKKRKVERKTPKGSLDDHTATLTDARKIKCEKCEREFLKKNGFTNHMKMHERKEKAEVMAIAEAMAKAYDKARANAKARADAKAKAEVMAIAEAMAKAYANAKAPGASQAMRCLGPVEPARLDAEDRVGILDNLKLSDGVMWHA